MENEGLPKGLKDEDAEAILLVLQQSSGVGDETADEAAVLALSPRFRARREEEFRSVEDINQYRHLRLYRKHVVQVHLQCT